MNAMDSMDQMSLAAALLLCGLLVLLPKRNAIKAQRAGIDPGFLGLKTGLGKLYFLIKGYQVVKVQYEKAKNEPYYLQSTNVDRLVLPPRYLAELRVQSSATLSGSIASVQNTIGEFSGVDIILKDRQSHDICRTRLTKSLPELVPKLASTLKSHLENDLKDCNNNSFVPRTAHKLLFSLNTAASSLVYVGPILSQDFEFMKAWTSIQPAIASVIIALTFFPRWLRPLIGPYIPPVKRLKAVQAHVGTFLFPNGRSPPREDFPSILQHYVSTARDTNANNITAKFCLLTTNSLHTITNTVTQVLFDLCLMPNYIPDLRRELQKALSKANGEWSLDVLKDLKIMDSFIKESQRWNPHSYLGFSRVLLSDVTLSDGFRIPKGQFISFPEEPMTKDPEFFETPDTFDAYRYYRKRVLSSDENSPFDLVGIEDNNLNWGHGKLTCPGRWYAAAVMKLMIGIILTEYDIKFPDGQNGRPQNSYLDTMIQPSETQVVLFRKVLDEDEVCGGSSPRT